MIELEDKLNALGDCYDFIRMAIKEIYEYGLDEQNELEDIATDIRDKYMEVRDELQEYSSTEYEEL